jgi:hypothetical protein
MFPFYREDAKGAKDLESRLQPVTRLVRIEEPAKTSTPSPYILDVLADSFIR